MENRTIELNFPWKVTFLYYASEEVPGAWVLKMNAEIPDVRTREPTYVGADSNFGGPLSDERLAAEMRHMLVDHFKHEVDEALHVAGLGRDPHAEREGG